jgi:hypothetical protein
MAQEFFPNPDMSSNEGLPEISCNRCIAPGTCCKSLPLSTQFPMGSTHESVQLYMTENGMPFIPLRRLCVYNGSRENGTGQHWYEQWLFTCPKVTSDGRCSIYEDRPHTCIIYEPGVDAMCVHMRLPNGEPIIPLLPVIPQ